MATGLPPELIAALAQSQAGGMPPPGPGAPPMGLPLGGMRPPVGLPPAAMLALGGAHPALGLPAPPMGPLGHPALTLAHLHRAALRRPMAPAGAQGPAGLAGALRSLVP